MDHRISQRIRAGLLVLVASLSHPVMGHGGGLNSEGCHTNRRTGDYHCHRAKSSPPPAQAAGFSGQAFSSGSGRPLQTQYANCSEVRAAGKAPLRRGDPGYAPHLDRDNDGIACEPPRR